MNYQTISLIVFWCERRDLLCSHSNGDIFTCECLYNKRCFAPEKRGYRCINFWRFLDPFMPEEQLTVDFPFLPKIGRVKEITVFPRIITGGDYYNFRTKRERCLREGDNFKQCSLNWIFCFIIPLNQKRSLQIYWTWAFKCSKLVPWLIFNVNIHYPQRQRLNPHWSVSLNQTPLQLDMEGIKEREGGQLRGGEGKAIIPGSRLF